MKKQDLGYIRELLAKEPPKRFVYSSKEDDDYYIHSFRLAFEQLETFYRPNIVILRRGDSNVVFHGVKYFEDYDRKGNERKITFVCRDRADTDILSRYDIILQY